MANALVSNQLDYCISFFRSLSKFNLHKLQRMQNTEARIITSISRYTGITPVLKRMTWLLVEYWSVYKTTTHTQFSSNWFPRYFDSYLYHPRYLCIIIIVLPLFRNYYTKSYPSLFIISLQIWCLTLFPPLDVKIRFSVFVVLCHRIHL